MPTSVILRQDQAGRLAIYRPAKGNPAYTDAKLAEAEASRARFRDDYGWYCVYTGFFRDLKDATLFCGCCNKGTSIERAMRAVRERQRDSSQVR